MCGILGGIDAAFTPETLDRLHHRGPDQRSFVSEALPGGQLLTLGQTRLNIVDRHDVHLPIRVAPRADGTEGGDGAEALRGDGAKAGPAGRPPAGVELSGTILFNGEIYNFIELRQELTALGWELCTRTDTEVALAAYLQWGPRCLDRFNGMFALAVWDGRRLFCARDRMGQKPLFYRLRGPRAFEFASEVKCFDELELVGNEVFDLFEFCLNEHTLYRGVLSLPPGHYLVYDLERGTLLTNPYWDIEHQVDRRIDDDAAAVNGFIELLEDSVRLRLRADVPVTLLLSGGVDSALIARLSGAEDAFTCQFEELRDTIDEESYARDLAARLSLRLHVIHPSRAQFLEDLPSLAYHLEMPTGSFSVFPLYRLSQAVREAGYKVVLTGEGSDELFAGYVRNELLLGDETAPRGAKEEQYASMLRRYHGSDLDRFCRMASRSGLAGAALLKMFLAEHWQEHRSMLQNMSYVEARCFLQPLLQMSDRMSMAHGLEARCPFLDHRLVAFAFSLGDRLRYRGGTGKWIVHQAARRLLPEGSRLLDRPVKHGLPTPVNLWMQGRRGFDRKHWNALMTAECIKALAHSA